MKRAPFIALALVAACTREPPVNTAPPPPAPARASASAPPPAAASAAASASTSTSIVIDARGTRLDGDEKSLVPAPADPTHGADAAYKRSGPNDLYLVPLADALKREKAAGHVQEPIPVIVAESVPYRLLVEALFTAGQSEIGSYRLCENACDKRVLEITAPRATSLSWDMQGLHLTALVVRDGVSLKAMGGNIAPGCTDVGKGIAIPRRGNALDLAALGDCLARLKLAKPEFEKEDTATLAGDASEPFREIMDVALTLQGPSKNLFPKLMLAVPH